MLLAFECEIGYRQVLRAHGFDHFLGLIGRDDFVFQALENDHGTIQLIGEMDRRAGDVEIAAFGVRADQSVEVARLEFMGVFRQRFQVADAVVAGAGFEDVAEGEGAQSGEAAGAAAANRQAIAIDLAKLCQVTGAVGAVVDIDDTPVAVQSFTIGAALA